MILPASPTDLVRLGLVTGVSHEAYRAAPGVSKSGLDRLARSPAHYLAYTRGERKETPALRFGRVAHWAILEPDDCRLIIGPNGDRRTKAVQTAWAECEAQAAAECAEVVTMAEADQLMRMREAVYAHPTASRLLWFPGLFEASCWWFDPQSGELCRCRPDKFRDDRIVVDYKTTEDASVVAFAKSCANYRYHVQAAMYQDGIRATTGRAVEGFVFLAQEKEPPYAVACYVLDAGDVERGRAAYQRDLMRLADCKIKRDWPAYSTKIEPLTLPAWAWKGEAA